MYTYQIYGLAVRSSHPIRDIPQTSVEQPADITVTWHPALIPHETQAWKQLHTAELDKRPMIQLWQINDQSESQLKLHLQNQENLFQFIFRENASFIDAYIDSFETLGDAQSYFLGMILGGTLRLRKQIGLHASVVAREGQAIAFIGTSGAGKSTTATAFIQNGWHFVSDDIAALEFINPSVQVYTGYPRVRLTSETIEGLYGRVPNESWVYQAYRYKHYIDVSSEKHANSKPLQLVRIYQLGPRDLTSPSIAPLKTEEKLLALLANTVGSYMITNSQQRAQELLQINRIIGCVPIKRLNRVDNIHQLSALCRLVQDDILQS